MFELSKEIFSRIQRVISANAQLALVSETPKVGVYKITCGTCQDTCKGNCLNRCNAVGKGIRR